MKSNWKYLPLFLILFRAASINAQEDWKLERDKEGIKVFSRSTEGSNFKSFKTQMILKGSVNTLVAILQDIENLKDWGYSLKSSELLKRSGDTVQIYYAESTAPFPIDNRDGIFLNTFRWDNMNNELLVEIELLPDFLKKKDNLIRLTGKGYWRVKVLKDMLDITFSMQVDPGGNLPGWVANIFVDTTPYSTMTELRKVMSDKKYQNKKFSFIK